MATFFDLPHEVRYQIYSYFYLDTDFGPVQRFKYEDKSSAATDNPPELLQVSRRVREDPSHSAAVFQRPFRVFKLEDFKSWSQASFLKTISISTDPLYKIRVIDLGSADVYQKRGQAALMSQLSTTFPALQTVVFSTNITILHFYEQKLVIQQTLAYPNPPIEEQDLGAELIRICSRKSSSLNRLLKLDMNIILNFTVFSWPRPLRKDFTDLPKLTSHNCFMTTLAGTFATEDWTMQLKSHKKPFNVQCWPQRRPQCLEPVRLEPARGTTSIFSLARYILGLFGYKI